MVTLREGHTKHPVGNNKAGQSLAMKFIIGYMAKRNIVKILPNTPNMQNLCVVRLKNGWEVIEKYNRRKPCFYRTEWIDFPKQKSMSAYIKSG